MFSGKPFHAICVFQSYMIDVVQTARDVIIFFIFISMWFIKWWMEVAFRITYNLVVTILTCLVISLYTYYESVLSIMKTKYSNGLKLINGSWLSVK